jgi:hypothetical protein
MTYTCTRYCFAKHPDLVERPELFVLHLSVAIAVANTMFVRCSFSDCIFVQILLSS